MTNSAVQQWLCDFPTNFTTIPQTELLQVVTTSLQIELPRIIFAVSKDKLNVLGKAYLSPGKSRNRKFETELQKERMLFRDWLTIQRPAWRQEAVHCKANS